MCAELRIHPSKNVIKQDNFAKMVIAVRAKEDLRDFMLSYERSIKATDLKDPGFWIQDLGSTGSAGRFRGQSNLSNF